MPYVAVDANGEVVAISSQPIAIKEFPEGIPVGFTWKINEAGDRFISPDEPAPWERKNVSGVDVEAIVISSTTDSIPFSYKKTDGTIREVETVNGFVPVQLGDVVVTPSLHATEGEIKMLNLTKDYATVIPRNEWSEMTTK